MFLDFLSRSKLDLSFNTLLFRLLAISDVKMRPHHSIWLTINVSDSSTSGENPTIRSVLVSQAMLQFVFSRVTFQVITNPRQRIFTVLGMQKTFPLGIVILEFIFLVSQHLFPTRRVIDLIYQEIPVPDTGVGSTDRKQESLFTLLQGCLGLFAFDDSPENGRHGGKEISLLRSFLVSVTHIEVHYAEQFLVRQDWDAIVP